MTVFVYEVLGHHIEVEEHHVSPGDPVGPVALESIQEVTELRQSLR
jgi:hypothetical protein